MLSAGDFLSLPTKLLSNNSRVIILDNERCSYSKNCNRGLRGREGRKEEIAGESDWTVPRNTYEPRVLYADFRVDNKICGKRSDVGVTEAVPFYEFSLWLLAHIPSIYLYTWRQERAENAVLALFRRGTLKLRSCHYSQRDRNGFTGVALHARA